MTAMIKQGVKRICATVLALSLSSLVFACPALADTEYKGQIDDRKRLYEPSSIIFSVYAKKADNPSPGEYGQASFRVRKDPCQDPHAHKNIGYYRCLIPKKTPEDKPESKQASLFDQVVKQLADPVIAHDPPGNIFYTNWPVSLYIKNPTQDFTVHLQGTDIAVKAKAVTTKWEHGDTTTQIYPGGGLPPPNITISHRYKKRGPLENLKVTAAWEVSWIPPGQEHYQVMGIGYSSAKTNPKYVCSIAITLTDPNLPPPKLNKPCPYKKYGQTSPFSQPEHQ